MVRNSSLIVYTFIFEKIIVGILGTIPIHLNTTTPLLNYWIVSHVVNNKVMFLGVFLNKTPFFSSQVHFLRDILNWWWWRNYQKGPGTLSEKWAVLSAKLLSQFFRFLDSLMVPNPIPSIRWWPSRLYVIKWWPSMMDHHHHVCIGHSNKKCPPINVNLSTFYGMHARVVKI